MKRFCLFVFAVASMLLAASCQQELNPVTDGDTTVTFTVNAGDVATRAIADGTNVDALHWEIYKTDDLANATQPLGKKTIIDKDGNKEFTVELKLLADQKYTIIFWAEVDGADHYITTDLRNVAINDYSDEEANDESRAAFFRVYPFETENGETITETIELYRPFSQINLGSTTYETSFNNVNGGNVQVVTSEMTVTKIATSFNTLTGKGEGEQVVTFKAHATPNAPADDTQKLLEVNDLYYYWLGMNYLIVCGDSDNVDVDITLDTNFGEVKHTISSVPVKENYRTNLLGNFLTTGATFNVVVDERFQTPDYIVPVPGEDGNGSSNTYTVSSAAELVWLQQQVNKEGNTFEGKTVKLTADIDLQGAEWTPIDGFKGTFDGSKGTKAADDNYTISNFTVNVNKCGGLFGSIVGSIKNVNIENATVVSNHFAGALVGYAYGRIENCHANNVTVTTVPELINGKYDNGDKAGAIVGYICGEPMSYLFNCSATNATVTAYRDLGAVAGCIAGTMTVQGNTAKDCKIVVDQIIDGEYAGSKTENANPVVGRNQSKNVTAAEFEEINKAAESVDNTVTTTPDEDTTLAELVATPGAVVEVPAGEYTFPASAVEAGVTINCAEGTVFTGNSKLNIKGATVVGATFSNPSGTAVDQTINGTFKNCVFEGSNALRWCYAGETVVFENCVFSGSVYGVHFDGGANDVLFKNCTFSGFNAFGGAITMATFDGCTFVANGKSGYNGANLWGNTTMINTEFTFDGTASYEWVDLCGADDGSYTFNGCTVCGKPMPIETIGVYTDNPNDVDITFNGVWYENYKTSTFISTAEELAIFATQVNEGENFKGKKVYLLSDIDLAGNEWTPIGNSTNQFQGTFDGNNKTISNLVITGNNSNVGLFGMTTNGEIKNLTVNNAEVSGYLNVAVVAGTPYTSKYTNIKVTGHVEVNGFAYVGAVGGKNAYANWTDVTVDVDETSYVNANSVENDTAYRTYVGGVCGFNGEGGHTFTNIASNIDVIGTTCDVGGLFGIAHYGNSFVNCSCSGDVEITAATEAADAEEMGGIAGVWHNQNGTKVTFDGCSFTGTLKANITEGVDLSDNTIVGKAYSASGTGELIIK